MDHSANRAERPTNHTGEGAKLHPYPTADSQIDSSGLQILNAKNKTVNVPEDIKK